MSSAHDICQKKNYEKNLTEKICTVATESIQPLSNIGGEDESSYSEDFKPLNLPPDLRARIDFDPGDFVAYVANTQSSRNLL